jgi:hypothetical protein
MAGAQKVGHTTHSSDCPVNVLSYRSITWLAAIEVFVALPQKPGFDWARICTHWQIAISDCKVYSAETPCLSACYPFLSLFLVGFCLTPHTSPRLVIASPQGKLFVPSGNHHSFVQPVG